VLTRNAGVYEDPVPPRKRKRPDNGTEELRARVSQYEMQLRLAGAIINERGDIITPPLSSSLSSAQTQVGGQRILVPAPRVVNTPIPSQSSESGRTLAEALRDASRALPRGTQHADQGRLIADRGKTRYIEK
jgi:hypothetical protein